MPVRLIEFSNFQTDPQWVRPISTRIFPIASSIVAAAVAPTIPHPPLLPLRQHTIGGAKDFVRLFDHSNLGQHFLFIPRLLPGCWLGVKSVLSNIS